MNAKHTETPWYTMVTHVECIGDRVCSCSGVGNRHTGEEQQANAEFIVRAVNAHDELVGICKEIDTIDASMMHALNAIPNTEQRILAKEVWCELVIHACTAVAKAKPSAE